MPGKTYITDVPTLLEQWDWEKNRTLDPAKITHKSQKKVFWVCSKGHSWGATPSLRSRGRGCPYCSGRRRIPGVNDLATLYSDLVQQWDYVKNHSIDPENISPASHKSVWWVCDYGHSYQAKINNRTLLKRGCPYCSGRLVIPGENDLATRNPELLQQWDYQKNHPLLPSEVKYGSSKKVWWVCDKGHSWQAAISSRSKKTRASGCPQCQAGRLLRGYNDLATVRPDLAAQWDHENNDIGPNEITCGSKKVVGWICEKGHRFSSAVGKRTTRGDGCRLCGNNVSASETEVADYISSILGDSNITRSNRSVISPHMN